jgi:membrane protein YdbS with pleckstrin-like domain
MSTNEEHSKRSRVRDILLIIILCVLIPASIYAVSTTVFNNISEYGGYAVVILIFILLLILKNFRS